jgi:HrpA-like RNA helicase
MKPTLFIKGKLASPNGDPKLKRELDEWIPLEYVIEWLRSRLNKTGIENRVLILKSETASGKSTAFPPELYKALVRGTGDRAPGIICTQPRVMTAIENVMEIMKHYSKVLRLGESIGWSTKFNKLRPKLVGLLSATIGTLAQQLRTASDEQIMKKYRFILIDETHERDLQTDMTIYMLKNLLLRNQGNVACPFVVLMSATFDPKSFIEYFKVPLLSNFIWCVGETAGFDENWDWNGGRTVNNYPQSAAQVVEKIITENPKDDPARADILIFVPGKAEYKEVARWLQQLNSKFAKDSPALVFSPLWIESTAVQTRNIDFMRTMYIPVGQHEVMIGGKTFVPSRRVIMSTNVAETGLTLDNLRYVIDAGYNREIEYNPLLGIRALITKPAPKSRIKQRKGRAGRKFRGVFYPLYPDFIFDKLPDLQFPQILIEDVSPIMLDIVNEQLKVKTLNGDRDPQFLIADIDLIDVPAPDALAACMEKLYTIGFISMLAPKWAPTAAEIIGGAPRGGDYGSSDMIQEREGSGDGGLRFGITKIGALASSFSMLAPESARMILSSYFWGCSVLDVITIAAYISIDLKSFVAPAPLDPTADKPPPRTFINWLAVYKVGLPGLRMTKNMLYKIRLLIADDFIHGVILFNAIKYIISAAEPKAAINSLREWCSQNNILYKSCIDLIKTRDDIIEQALGANMRVFAQEEHSLKNAKEEDFMNIITKLKYCIYDGYRNNIIVKDGPVYKTSNGIRVLPPALFQENEQRLADEKEYGHVLGAVPRTMVYRELSIKYNRKTSIYDVLVDRVSACDGFISIDPDFCS